MELFILGEVCTGCTYGKAVLVFFFKKKKSVGSLIFASERCVHDGRGIHGMRL